MDKLDDILRQNFNKGSKNLTLFTYPWEELVGELSAHIKPVNFRAGILTVTAKNSSWANELSFHTEEIKNQINAFLKKDSVKEVRVIGKGFEHY